MRVLVMAQGAPGGAVFDAIGLDRIAEPGERDLRSAHEAGLVVDGLAV